MTTRAELSEIATEEGGHTRLMRAAHEGDVQAIRALCGGTSDVNAIDNEGRTALMFATVNRHRKAVSELLKHGADVNARDNDGYTALIFAASSGDEEIVSLLLGHEADVSVKVDSTGETALAVARRNRHEDVVRVLEQYGA
jgi:ankyrin repeat protein